MRKIKPTIRKKNKSLISSTLPEASIDHIHNAVIEYAEHTLMYELHYMTSHFEDYADELATQWMSGDNEGFDDDSEWDQLHAEITEQFTLAIDNVKSQINNTFERLKSGQLDSERSTMQGSNSKAFTVNEAKTFAKEHGVSGFDKIKNTLTHMIKDSPDLSKNLQSVADTVYKYIYNDVPDSLQDEAEMLADQLLEKYSGAITTEEQDKAMGRGPIDSKELKKAMDRSVGLESGIFDGIKKKIGDKIANQWNKENEKYRKELTEEIYRGDIRKYKEMLRQKFINWYSTNTEPYGPGVNAKTYLDIYTKQVIKKIKLDLISLLTEDNSEKIESTIKRYVDDINKYSELLYSNVEKYMKDEEQR